MRGRKNSVFFVYLSEPVDDTSDGGIVCLLEGMIKVGKICQHHRQGVLSRGLDVRYEDMGRGRSETAERSKGYTSRGREGYCERRTGLRTLFNT